MLSEQSATTGKTDKKRKMPVPFTPGSYHKAASIKCLVRIDKSEPHDRRIWQSGASMELLKNEI